MKRKIQKLGVGVVVAGVLTTVGVVGRGVVLDEGSRAGPIVTPTPTRVRRSWAGLELLLVTSEGRIELRDRPNGTVTLTLEQMTRVRIVESEEGGSEQWLRMQVVDGEGQGWVRTSDLSIQVAPAVNFFDFGFCLGDASGPTGPCSTLLAQPTEGLWLQWEYSGLERGDVVQSVLVVNGERYQSPATRWNGPRAGQQLVNLLDYGPRIAPGLWTVQFYLNGDLINEAGVQVR